MSLSPLKLRTAAQPKTTDAVIDGALADRVEAAEARLAHQINPALVEALSESELRAERALAESVRRAQRQDRLAVVESATAAAARNRRTLDALAQTDAEDLIRAREAIAEQQRQMSPTSQLAYLHRRKKNMLRLLTGTVALSMLISAVSVQQNIGAGGPGELMWWVSFGFEAMVSSVLIALMLSGGDCADDSQTHTTAERNQPRLTVAEVVLLLVTLGLNTWPYVHKQQWFDVFVHSLAPIMIGVALDCHGRVAARYSKRIARVSAALPVDDITARLATMTNAAAALTAHATAPAHAEPRTATEPHTAHAHTDSTNPHTAHAAQRSAEPHTARAVEPLAETATADSAMRAAHEDRTSAKDISSSDNSPASNDSVAREAHMTADQAAAAPSTIASADATHNELATRTSPDRVQIDDENHPHIPATVGAHALHTDPAPAGDQLDATEIWGSLADEVRRRHPRMRTDRDHVVAVLAAAATETGLSEDGYTAIARSLEVHRDTVLKIITTGIEVLGQAAQGATVLTLRPRQED